MAKGYVEHGLFISLQEIFEEEKLGLILKYKDVQFQYHRILQKDLSRVSDKEFKHFISIYVVPSFELETQLILAFKFGYLSEEQLTTFDQMIKPVQKMSFGLYNSLQK
ncbi:MAG: four helix bundle protein [Ferruginibacter sp.]